jgi:hypothetical protein
MTVARIARATVTSDNAEPGGTKRVLQRDVGTSTRRTITEVVIFGEGHEDMEAPWSSPVTPVVEGSVSLICIGTQHSINDFVPIFAVAH